MKDEARDSQCPSCGRWTHRLAYFGQIVFCDDQCAARYGHRSGKSLDQVKAWVQSNNQRVSEGVAARRIAQEQERSRRTRYE